MNDATPTPSIARDEPRFFSLSQRLNRLRYFTYTLVGCLAGAALLIAVYLLCLLLPTDLGRLISTVAFILVKNVGIPLLVFIMTIRRLHDFNASGWWSIVVLMPFTTLVFLFIPGSPEANRFGHPQQANSPALRFTAIALPLAVLAFYWVMLKNQPEGTGAPRAPEKVLRPYGS